MDEGDGHKMWKVAKNMLIRQLRIADKGLCMLRNVTYEGVFISCRTGGLERELQMVQLSATRCSCIANFMSQSSEFCRHSPLCFSTNVYYYYYYYCLFCYRLSPETFGYILVVPRTW
jgi:hypothetical protein